MQMDKAQSQMGVRLDCDASNTDARHSQQRKHASVVLGHLARHYSIVCIFFYIMTLFRPVEASSDNASKNLRLEKRRVAVTRATNDVLVCSVALNGL